MNNQDIKNIVIRENDSEFTIIVYFEDDYFCQAVIPKTCSENLIKCAMYALQEKIIEEEKRTAANEYIDPGLKSNEEFIARLKAGEIFYSPLDEKIYYQYIDGDFVVFVRGESVAINPRAVGIWNVLIKAQK